MFSILISVSVGLIFVYIGWRIWKKEQISLIHEYHHKKVSEEDKMAYTEKMGKACIIIGIGILLSGVIDFVFKISYGWIVFTICFIWAIITMSKAQKKYNGGWF